MNYRQQPTCPFVHPRNGWARTLFPTSSCLLTLLVVTGCGTVHAVMISGYNVRGTLVDSATLEPKSDVRLTVSLTPPALDEQVPLLTPENGSFEIFLTAQVASVDYALFQVLLGPLPNPLPAPPAPDFVTVVASENGVETEIVVPVSPEMIHMTDQTAIILIDIGDIMLDSSN